MIRLTDEALNKLHQIFPELCPFANFGILNLLAGYLENYFS